MDLFLHDRDQRHERVFIFLIILRHAKVLQVVFDQPEQNLREQIVIN